MATITFYRQARRDGAVRTGIEIDSNTVLAKFEGGSKDRDPALIWYVDLRFQGGTLPRLPEPARQWLVRHAAAIQRELQRMAADLPAGMDPGDWPLQRKARLTSGGVTLTIACSAVRRLEGQKVASILRDIAEHWTGRIEALPSQ